MFIKKDRYQFSTLKKRTKMSSEVSINEEYEEVNNAFDLEEDADFE